jgi:hypothetical protein
MNIFTLRNFNRISRHLNKAVTGLEKDIIRVEADIEKQAGIIAKAQDASVNLAISKLAVNNLRDQLKAITA